MNMEQMSRGTALSLQQHMDPRMLSQFGGAQGFNKMVCRTFGHWISCLVCVYMCSDF
jgi:hypothetical protein